MIGSVFASMDFISSVDLFQQEMVAMKRISIALLPWIVAFFLVFPGDLWSQAPGPGGMPKIPTREEIEKRIKAELEKLPKVTAEHGGVKITYREVPSDPAELIKRGIQIPPGMNVDQLVKQYGPMVQPIINKHMQEIGTLETTATLRYRSKKIPEGSYTFGVVFNNITPTGLLIQGGKLKKPVGIALKRKATKQPVRALQIQMKEEKKKKDYFRIYLGFHLTVGKTDKFKILGRKKS
jgi:hypothetical protein